MKIEVQIQKFDPEKDEKPYFQDYFLEIEEGATILDGLIHIKDYLDPTLAFRRACRAAICGSCALKINGRAKLACKTQIQPEIKKSGFLKIEPLSNLKIIKDLIVDLDPFFEQIKAVQPWLIPKEGIPFKFGQKRERLMLSEDFEKIRPASTCILCAICYSDCPVTEFDSHFLGPAAAVKAFERVFDVRDRMQKERLKNLAKKGIWYCAHCETCVARCPKEIMPQDLVSLLRELSVREGVKSHPGARHVRSFYQSIQRTGELDEARLPLNTLGPIRAIKFLKTGLRLLKRKKLPPLFPKKIKKLHQVKTIYQETLKRI